MKNSKMFKTGPKTKQVFHIVCCCQKLKKWVFRKFKRDLKQWMTPETADG